jgi:serine protease AprX
LLVVPAVPGDAKDRDRGRNSDRSDRSQPNQHRKLDRTLNRRAAEGGGTSRVIVIFKDGSAGTAEIGKHGSKARRRFRLVNAQTADVPNSVLKRLADDPAIESIHEDRPTAGALNRVAVSIGARAVQTALGLKGAGVGVAVIDSGITSWHDDLTYNGTSSAVRTKGGQRVVAFADFVNGRTSTYDDNGHGSHVAGTIAGNGYDTYGARAGIAPEAHLLGLKVLDENGRGVISDVMAALEWAVANKTAYNIRVANLSVGAAVTESYWTDPLTLAAKRAVDAGIVVVAAAGNLGKNKLGNSQYGGITAPGNAPWVLTVGAYSHEGTLSRYDDVIASYSSRGPSAVDFEAKPDLVAPGSGVVSLADPSSLFYSQKAANLLTGSRATSYKPYLSLSGTSMAAPVVSGTVALMMQANPSLTPNMVKAILQYTAQSYGRYNALTQGAGFLNAEGAVQLAKFFKSARSGDRLYLRREWSKRIHWGSYRIGGGLIRPTANAFELGTVWGAVRDTDGDNIVWGTLRDDDNIVWGTVSSVVGLVLGTIADEDNIVWGTLLDGDNIVWGTLADVDNIVWGTDCGGADCDNIVWGTMSDVDNIVWGTATDGDNIVWGTATGDDDNSVWATSGDEEPVLFDDPDRPPTDFNDTSFETLVDDSTTGGR